MSYSIEKADLNQQGQYLRELWQRNFAGVPHERYAWMYENNPAGQPVVFLLKYNQRNEFVGAMALFPHMLLVKGKQVKSYICGDMAVHQAHRTLGPAMALIKAAVSYCEENKPCILLSLPNNKSLPVLQRAGFQPLGIYYSLTKVVKTGTYLRRHFKSTVIADSLAFFADRLVARFYKLQSYWFGRGYVIDLVTTFDREFDDFITNASNHFQFVGERTIAFLNWRLKDSPYGRNDILVIKKNNRLCGYVSCCIRNNRCDIEDIAFDGSYQNLKALMVVFTTQQLQNGIEAITLNIAAPDFLVDVLKNAGFSVRSQENQFLIYASPQDQQTQLAASPGVWYLTTADNDI